MDKLDRILNFVISEERQQEVPQEFVDDKDFQELSYLWELSDVLKASKDADADSGWQSIDLLIGGSEVQESVSEPKIVGLYPWRLGVAASFLLVLGFALYFLQPQNPYITIVAQSEHEEVVLPDDSRVTLRDGATIRYLSEEAFSESERIVFLDGAAIFDVERDEDHPFKVVTSGTTVDVLGTEFSYRAEGVYSESENISGLVNFVVNEDPSQAQLLNPGDKVSYDGNELAFTPAFVPPPPTPRNRVMLVDLIDILGDRYPASLILSPGLSPGRTVIEVDLRGSLSEILADLSQNETVRLDFVDTRGTFYLNRIEAIDQGLTPDYRFQDYLIGRPLAQ
ncbi:MAG: FecR domain-containing protein [Saprospiraceae bacterium]|nr:FecR domain-containing protein [Saprospiraceae bacterium]